ncbi:MAG: extracellular solute-binding protein [Chloroflexi bacterium]|nr:extracellular solute-binding protein [Chloroflexota bacterium]
MRCVRHKHERHTAVRNGVKRARTGIQWTRVAALALIATLLTACAPQPPGPQVTSQPPGISQAVSDASAQQADAPSQPAIEIAADTFDLQPAQGEIADRYDKPSVFLRSGESIQFDVNVPEPGEFTIAFDVATPASSGRPEGQLRIDGVFPIADLQRVIFPVFYRNSSDVFPTDRYGNDVLIRQARDERWTNTPARDVNFSHPYPIRVNLSAGTHRFEFTLSTGELVLGSIYLRPFRPYPNYTAYLAAHQAQVASGVAVTLEAELPNYKNDTSVRPVSDRNLAVTPYDTYRLLLNTLGGESWDISGTAVYYEVQVPASGLYEIALRAMQNTRSNFTVFRRITVNGQVPFAELNAVPFPYSAGWENIPLGGSTPYRVYLHEGVNVLGVEATNSPYLTAIETIQESLLSINTLALEIKRLTGNQRDPFKEWVISDYIPDIEARLNAIAQRLIDDKDTLLAIDPSGASPEVLMYQVAIDNLLFLAADPDKVPVLLGRFSEGTGSAAQQLGSLLPLLQDQPLALDKIYVYAPDSPPETPGVAFTTNIGEEIKRFAHSFQPDPYQSIGAADDELEVWVNRPRQYVNLLQTMADSSFTTVTGIRVKFSIMPDESKLILANAAGIQPDVALGVSTDKPYELAIRNALYDLRTFPDFDSFISIYSPGALLGYIVNDSVYAIPETQDFWVTFYRRDILESLGIPVPDTWDEVLEILPELQRYGMNYNTPLSTGAGQKGYLLTAPYLFNYGAELYSEDGFATGLQSEEAVAAVKFMAESFTIYGMPLTTVSFYQDFRYGTLPLGISNAESYNKLTTAAPEIGGLWGIDLYPATVLPDGTQNRYATGSAQTSIMFANTDKADEGWQFLKWWMSTETQTEFQEQLILSYGREYVWFSANLEAFAQLDIPAEHKAVILEQWQWLQEPVRLPGSYMQERELSNVWNRIVFDGDNPRVAIDRSITVINREIARKMEEFGYLLNGEPVREFKIPTIDTVRSWMNHGE